MALYYQNSALTIAATYGDGTTGSFSAETADNSTPLIRLPYRANTSGIASRPSFFYLVPSDCYHNNDYGDHVIRSDLLTRGWVIQEWVLSRRILCYAPNTVYFQCVEELPHNEDGGVRTMKKTEEGKRTVMQLDRHRSSDLDLELKLKSVNLSWRREGIYSIWLDVVMAYSERNLTRPETDKLMGIVGIADEFGRALVDQLGLTEAKSRIWVGSVWLEDIHKSLLWEQTGHLPASVPSPSPERHDAGRIVEVPSWSWASRRCSVRWTHFESARWMHSDWKTRFSCEVRAVRDARARQPQTATAATPTTVEGADEDWESLPVLGWEPAQARLVDPTKVFPVLCLRTRVITILVRETFTEGEERQVASFLSGHNAPGRWRKVALSSSPQLICGWVSPEREQNQREINASGEPLEECGPGKHHRTGGDQLQADTDDDAGAARGETNPQLPMLTPIAASQQQVMPGQDNGKGNRVEEQEGEIERQTAIKEEDLGYMSGDNPVYNVLCLRRHPGDATVTTSGFERIGSGRLFGRGVQRLFENTEPQEVQLF
ncbi:hypothetical protein GJ744_002846 [Endocarpon pusillum]|uniref:Heterokaryon incompatibility domain-containing protein n=1 Tax=Endocarpon pusillum TaxID=364733 RepID=A0A8H7ABH6_9EURO|nr:hypothetical protein GJ744_002846 [Endocarpon pusillum]